MYKNYTIYYKLETLMALKWMLCSSLVPPLHGAWIAAIKHQADCFQSAGKLKILPWSSVRQTQLKTSHSWRIKLTQTFAAILMWKYWL